jgi:hypothetical protein
VGERGRETNGAATNAKSVDSGRDVGRDNAPNRSALMSRPLRRSFLNAADNLGKRRSTYRSKIKAREKMSGRRLFWHRSVIWALQPTTCSINWLSQISRDA